MVLGLSGAFAPHAGKVIGKVIELGNSEITNDSKLISATTFFVGMYLQRFYVFGWKKLFSLIDRKIKQLYDSKICHYHLSM